MITAGDIQFEPPSPKIIFLSSAIAVMSSGDSAFHAEIMKEVLKEVNEHVARNPTDWWLVKDVVDLYIKYRNIAKRKRAEAAILSPLSLDSQTFLLQQKGMDSELVQSISSDLINFNVPEVDVIIAGIDTMQNSATTHIYSIFNDYISCDDVIGFRAIGSGARHAESQFMLARHAWNAEPHAAIMLAYRAKKDAEVAPGVGTDTDVYMIGPSLGQASIVREDIVAKLDHEYRKMKRKAAKIEADANKEVKQYVDSVPHTTAPQADKPSSNGSSAPPNGS